ncbi:hypothetical protein HK101_001044 [Irineochytrium annulatum]|nr:hypothetical protein HK101_001044 [Irineochytrium annulatum]
MMSTLLVPDECYVPPRDGPLKLAIGIFIISGLLISYLPQGLVQFSKLYLTKSSRGLSPWFLLLGSVGCFATLSNIVVSQWTPWPILTCIENTLGFTQIFVQFLCFHVVFTLYYVYMPPDLLPSDFEYVSSMRVLRASLTWGALSVIIVSTTVALGDPEWNQIVKTFTGGVGVMSALVQFLPQIVKTFELKSPGGFLLVYSISISPDTDWTSWIAFFISACLQSVLLVLCLFFHHFPSKEAVEGEAEGLVAGAEEGTVPAAANARTPLIG